MAQGFFSVTRGFRRTGSFASGFFALQFGPSESRRLAGDQSRLRSVPFNRARSPAISAAFFARDHLFELCFSPSRCRDISVFFDEAHGNRWVEQRCSARASRLVLAEARHVIRR
jgi:hypothetical protein